ncbi:MAG TPA: hypoxanthine phosphoribosyltransferase [Thermodesulfobacteriota bacterium]|nr:hypoxanthine phosphoribosyltransferase [Thermodesulfobacteriota bacterium]
MLELLFTPEQISAAVDDLARRIRADYAGKDPVLVGILKGSFLFLADLCRRLPSPLSIDFIRLASYGGTRRAHEVRLTKDVELPLAGRHVLIVEDIVDSGHTVAFLREHFSRHAPASLRIAALVDKTGGREVDAQADYVGLTIPGGFIVGYGLDLDERYRNLPGIYLVKG